MKKVMDEERGLVSHHQGYHRSANLERYEGIKFWSFDGRKAAGNFTFGGKWISEKLFQYMAYPHAWPPLHKPQQWWIDAECIDDEERQYFENLSPLDGCRVIGFSKQDSLEIVEEAMQVHWHALEQSNRGETKMQMEFSDEIREWVRTADH